LEIKINASAQKFLLLIRKIEKPSESEKRFCFPAKNSKEIEKYFP